MKQGGKFDCERQVLAVAGANMAIRKSAWLSVREQVSDRPDIHEDIDLSLCLREEGMTIGQIADMRAETSGRRGETPPPLEYLKYNQASESVLHLHNIMNWRLKLTIWATRCSMRSCGPSTASTTSSRSAWSSGACSACRKVESCQFTSNPSNFANRRRFAATEFHDSFNAVMRSSLERNSTFSPPAHSSRGITQGVNSSSPPSWTTWTSQLRWPVLTSVP